MLKVILNKIKEIFAKLKPEELHDTQHYWKHTEDDWEELERWLHGKS